MSSLAIVCESGDPNLDAAVNLWLRLDQNITTINEVRGYIRAEDWGHLRKVMLNRMKFGTAGMRARMCAGFACMNDVTILQTAQGLCSYLRKQCTRDQLDKGIVVGYDGRHNSKRYAMFTTKVFVEANIPVTLFFEECPTPLVAYATAEIGAAAGVMVTASHNPKEDNGYKVYWSNGSQILAPHDDNLLDEILDFIEIPSRLYDVEGVTEDARVSDGCRLASDYAAGVRDSLAEDVLMGNRKFPIQIVYSAMHGVGTKYIAQTFHYCNLKQVIGVKAQMSPDPEFPTVKFPNPEEAECLEMSKLLAMQSKVKLVLANDPDADRLAVAEFDERTKEWKTFTGNEMGAILGWWLLEQYYKRNPDANPDDVYVLASVVSSKMLRAIVEGKGHFVETLTGFKWMGNTALLLKQQGKVPVFAFEEAIGYMCFPQVVDKDGISAAVHVASLATNLYSRGLSLKEQLKDLYKEYGYHLTHNSYFMCHDPAVIQMIFRGIRNYDGPGKYPKKVASSDIIYIHDLAAGVKISEIPEGEAHLNVVGTGLEREYTGGEMVMLRTRDGLSVTVRTSGTEPKVKYYTEMVFAAGEHTEDDEERMQKKLKDLVNDFIDKLIQPRKYGLK